MPFLRSAEHGFTLVEVMVALTVFALLSAAGVYLLSGSVRAQGAVQARLDGLAGLQRAAGLMTVDLAQAVPRVSRTAAGTLAPAFFAGDGASLMFVRVGRDNPDGLPRSGVQKLEYAIDAGRLVRRDYPQVDGTEPGAGTVVMEGIAAGGFRFRGPDGGWRGDWRPSDPLALPRAVELTVAQAGGAPVRLLFVVGADPLPPPKPPAIPGA